MPAPRQIPTPSRRARLAARLSLAEAAAFLERSPRYLGRLERLNSFPLQIAQRLAWKYGARLDDFLPQPPQGGVIRRKAGPAKRKSPVRPRRG
jgi:hypothetical protein